ncbi:MAG: 2-phospho-L-lactate guanylyltransferase [Candidatus Acidiferrales bacterium]
MKALLIPVKEFARAKERLAQHLPAARRAGLARAFAEDFFRVVQAARGFERVFVVSNEPEILERARTLGWETIPESRQNSESDSVDSASRWCAEGGVTSLLRLPVDLPIVAPEDIEMLFAQQPAAPGMVIVPSRDGDGTNALLRTPPALFSSHFGPGSFRKHLDAAAGAGAGICVVRNPRLEFDVDDCDDLGLLSSTQSLGSATAAWLADYRESQSRSRSASL